MSMINDKNGFTLLELLIAAALIGVLAMFATQAFRASSSDIRVADAKARALLVANAAERYYIEYPTAASFSDGMDRGHPIPVFKAPDRSEADAPCNTRAPGVQDLVDCGFLEYRQVARDTKDSEGTYVGSVNMWFKNAGKDNVKVCFQGMGRVTDKFIYCTTQGGTFNKESPPDD